jgi:hypothetical protein
MRLFGLIALPNVSPLVEITIYAGNWDFYTSGAWAHEPDQIGTIWNPGFYLWGQAIACPQINCHTAHLDSAILILTSSLIFEASFQRKNKVFRDRYCNYSQ